MGVVVRPRFGRPCYDGCGALVPPRRVAQLQRRDDRSGRAVQPSDRICVDCERRQARERMSGRR